MLILVPTTLEWRGLFPELEPPRSARDVVRWRVHGSLGEPVDVARCGFGLAASGARAAALLAGRADRAVLAGIAGTLVPDELPVGALVAATGAEVEGIGFGEGLDVVHPQDAAPALAAEWNAQRPATPWLPPLAVRRGRVLSAASSSGNAAQAAARRRRHPSCVAEDMESEAVLQAAAALPRQVAVLRAISNVAGERQGWRTGEALAKLREALDAWLAP